MNRIQRALISVSDKSGIVQFTKGLENLDIEILSTGGTANALREAGIDVTDVSDYTGFPEMLGGRIKTLHPKIHSGLLFRRDSEEDRKAIEMHGISPIDLVVVNLYPFRETIQQPDVSLQEAMEQVDIGGPCMLRSAAKNHRWVTVVCRPDLYKEVLEELERLRGQTSDKLRLRLAAEAFRHTADYDRAISQYLYPEATERDAPPLLSETLDLTLTRTIGLRYGENPHQAAGYYGNLERFFTRLHGKLLSYNNLLDLSAAVELIEEFSGNDNAAVAIIKHTNPCGIALGSNLSEAWEKALATDRDSASGGIVAFNRPLDRHTAEAIHGFFTEILAAPDFDPEALEILRKKKNRIVVQTRHPVSSDQSPRLRSVPGGVLAQQPDLRSPDPETFKVVSHRQPTEAEMASLLFAWKVVKHVKSNAVVFSSQDRSLAIGAGQMSRVDAVRVAILKAGQAGCSLGGSVVASDAFFPFADGLLLSAKAGATAAIQPGGSRRDDELINTANDNNVAMVFTGERHFRH